MLHQLRGRGHAARVRGRRRRRRHVVLEPLSRRALRHRESGVLLLVLRSAEHEWQWTERYASQPELLRYTNHVADRFDLRRDIQFNTRVTAATFDERAKRWTVTTDRGDRCTAKFCVMATGCLSVPKDADLPGPENFAGRPITPAAGRTSGVDFTGQNVAVIGTGSSAIQSIPQIAAQASHLTVFQRTPNFSLPANNGPLNMDVVNAVKPIRASMRARSAQAPFASVCQSTTDATRAQRAGGGTPSARTKSAGSTAVSVPRRVWRPDHRRTSERHGGRVRTREDPRPVNDPQVAEQLMPQNHPIGLQAPLRRYRLLRDIQPRQRDAGRPQRRRRSSRSRRTA